MTLTAQELAAVEHIAEREDELVALVSDLIGFDTTARATSDEPARDERALQEYLAGRLAGAGARCDLWEPRSEEVAGSKLAPAGLDFEGRPQLAATFARVGRRPKPPPERARRRRLARAARALDDGSLPRRPPRWAALRPRRLRHEGRGRLHGLRGGSARGARHPARGRPRRLHGDGGGVDGGGRPGRGRARGARGCRDRARAVRPRDLHRVPWQRHSHDHGGRATGPLRHPSARLARRRRRERDREGRGGARCPAPAPGGLATPARPAPPAPVSRGHRSVRDRRRRVGGELSVVLQHHVPHRVSALLRGREGWGSRIELEVAECVQRAAETDPWLAENPPTIEWAPEVPSAEVEPDAPIVTDAPRGRTRHRPRDGHRRLRQLARRGHLHARRRDAVRRVRATRVDRAHTVDEYVPVEASSPVLRRSPWRRSASAELRQNFGSGPPV